MKRNVPVFFMIVVAGGVCAAFLVCGPVGVARAYELPSSAPSSSLFQGYNLNTSFSSLVSPFENFFNSIKNGNVAPVTLNIGNSGTTNVTVGINVQQYVNQYVGEFDTWFYGITGIHIQGAAFFVVNLLYWALGAADAAVRWIVGLFNSH